MIMSTLREPSVRNVNAMRETFIKYAINNSSLEHSYDFYEYVADENMKEDDIRVEQDEILAHYWKVYIGSIESVYSTYEKTYLTYKYIIENTEGYDRFIRINISAYLNINLLDKVIGTTNEDYIYANALNTYNMVDYRRGNEMYPRGDFYILSTKTVKGILEHGKKYMHCDRALKNRPNIPHVDDTLVGCAITDYFGLSDYVNHLYMIYYNFLPMPDTQLYSLVNSVNMYAICSRVKTTPQGSVSGYSWDDNSYRLSDPKKIEYLHSIFVNEKYNEIDSIEDLIVPPEQERHTLFASLHSVGPTEIKKFLGQMHIQQT